MAREVLTDHLKYEREAETLNEIASREEVSACIRSAELTSDCSEKASWTYWAAFLQVPNPENLLLSARVEDAQLHRKAADSWEKLGDLLVFHDKQLDISTLPFRLVGMDGSKDLKWLAAACYKSAAFALGNAIISNGYREKKYEWNDLDNRKIEILDKGITTLTFLEFQNKIQSNLTPEVKASDNLVSNAKFYAQLADFHQMKLNSSYKQIEKTEFAELKKKILQLRLKSSDCLGELLENEKYRYHTVYYEHATQLREAAINAHTIGEAHPLFEQAAISVSTYLNDPMIWDVDEEHEMFCILARCDEADKLLSEKGADHPNLKTWREVKTQVQQS